MTGIEFTDDGRKAFDRIVDSAAPILRERRREKLTAILAMLLAARRVSLAGKAEVSDAGRFVLTKVQEPLLDMLRAGPVDGKPMTSSYGSVDAYMARERQVTRWPNVSTPPSHPPADCRVLAILASPRKGGNTEVLLEEALRGVRDAGVRQVEKVRLQSLNMRFCIGCRKCKAPDFAGFCVIKDDLREVFPKLVAADVVVFGFPIYQGRECGQLATFLDRMDCFWGPRFLKRLPPGKRAMVIGTWGQYTPGAFDHVLEHVIGLLHAFGIETTESISACGFAGQLYGWDREGKAIICRYPAEVAKAYQAGRNLVTGTG